MDTQTKELIRTPAELAPLIKEQIQFGDVASQEAGMPYYRKAGGLLLEAKPGVKQEGKETFEGYCVRVTGKSTRQCKLYIQAYREIAKVKKLSKKGGSPPEKPSASLNELEGKRSSGRVFREWTAPVDAAVGDFEITMLISEIHDHGWPMAAKTLTIMPVEDADAHNPGT